LGKALTPWLGIGGGLTLVVAGLDALLGWSPSFGSPVKVISLVFLLAGHVLTSYALINNRYFSEMVRLQTERGHQVVSSGPNKWVRHPGYAGTLLTYLATPFFLDSSEVTLPILCTVIVMVVRTFLEDRFLQRELTGCREYTLRMRYCLPPGVR
jgi:protein-S-isoprenylcysteine O-methyltransferase Ste14